MIPRNLATASIQGTAANTAVTDPGNAGDWQCDGGGQAIFTARRRLFMRYATAYLSWRGCVS